MNKSLTVLSSRETPTMSSLEMVDYINADRKSKAEAEGLAFPCKKYRKLEHRSFMKKVPKVLGDAAAKFFATDTCINGTLQSPSTGGPDNETGIYSTQICAVSSPYSRINRDRSHLICASVRE